MPKGSERTHARIGSPVVSANGGVRQPARVLMLGKGWFPAELGGLDRYYRELLEHLPEATGIVVGPADDPGPGVAAISEHTAPIARRLLAFTGAAWRQRNSADVVDAHFALYAFLPLLSGLRNKPLLVHFQGPWADENFAGGDPSRWRHAARRALERLVYSRADVVVVLSGAFRRVLVETYGVSPWRTKVLPPGVDLDRFSTGDRMAARTQLGLAPDVFVACCARRLVPRMGVDVLIEAWARAFANDRDARLLIAGDGELREELEHHVTARSLGDSVTLLGRVGDDELRALYRAADVNVVPSISFEGFGLVVLEAAACGTPTIVTRTGGLPEAITGLGEDLTVPAGNVDALAERLARAEQGELPSRGHTRSWAAAHGWESVAAAHCTLFQRLIADRDGVSRKLRVVYLDHVAQLSGAELALLRLLTALTDVEPHVILAEDGPLADRLLQAGVSVEVLTMPGRTRQLRKDRVRPGRLPPRATYDTITYALRLALRLRRLRPDVVHANSLKSGIYGSIAARLAGVPVVWHVRDRIAPDYLPSAAVHVVRWLTAHLPDLLVCNSEATKRTLRPGNSAVVISIADMVDPVKRPRTAPSDAPLVVGIVGRLAPWKGQDVFLRAFARAFPDGQNRAVVIGAPLFGKAEVAYEEDLRQLAKQLGMGSRVEFRGHREDIASELRTIDILVHASTTPEPFGQVVIEGMSAGLPVVASRGGGPEETITDGVDGLLHPPGDDAALAQILIRLNAEPDLRGKLGRAATVRALDFSPDQVAPQMMAAYEVARIESKRRHSRGRSIPGR